jgi:hypothetical protein
MMWKEVKSCPGSVTCDNYQYQKVGHNRRNLCAHDRARNTNSDKNFMYLDNVFNSSSTPSPTLGNHVFSVSLHKLLSNTLRHLRKQPLISRTIRSTVYNHVFSTPQATKCSHTHWSVAWSEQSSTVLEKQT